MSTPRLILLCSIVSPSYPATLSPPLNLACNKVLIPAVFPFTGVRLSEGVTPIRIRIKKPQVTEYVNVDTELLST